MRGAYILFVAVAATLLASCDVASTTQLQLSEMTASNRIQSVDDVVNDNSSNRLLRVWHFDGDDLKKFPLSEVKVLLENKSRRKEYFELKRMSASRTWQSP
ncbi:hypothetical protein PC116_g20079 [Phytophthora cactorum]|nr:hypothetical protein Pcac1_g15382 [Phytophthora cactorum]KAG2903307.1 hypothetical protein PC114_g12331 [Phytophthora cactorum]KAG3001007.1 hypothetical protein PC119_g16869 [Phytophthora cactorum]KAG4054206.1 hypothetical protein PC123_g10656 [Phytophthora cactorum]KAG4231658.1 hypothetical protein PC116_g20079 [Phytophthora cactorum]